MELVSLHIYPVKSLAGLSLKSAEVVKTGFKNDRLMMVVENKHRFMTQRKYPQMATITVDILESGDWQFSIRDKSLKPTIISPTDTGIELDVEVWSSSLRAIDQGNEIAKWITDALGLSSLKHIRLVKMVERFPRKVDENYAKSNDDIVSFADGYPFLLTTTGSLKQVNEWVRAENNDNSIDIPMSRFRPNIVVSTKEPFLEDNWKVIKIGDVIFDVAKECGRCGVTCTNQEDGSRDPNGEPLKTLTKYRRRDSGGVIFGQNLIPRNTGEISLTSQFQVLE